MIVAGNAAPWWDGVTGGGQGWAGTRGTPQWRQRLRQQRCHSRRDSEPGVEREQQPYFEQQPAGEDQSPRLPCPRAAGDPLSAAEQPQTGPLCVVATRGAALPDGHDASVCTNTSTRSGTPRPQARSGLQRIAVMGDGDLQIAPCLLHLRSSRPGCPTESD